MTTTTLRPPLTEDARFTDADTLAALADHRAWLCGSFAPSAVAYRAAHNRGVVAALATRPPMTALERTAYEHDVAQRAAWTATQTLAHVETQHSRDVTAHWTAIHDAKLAERRDAIYAHREVTEALAEGWPS